MLKIKLQGLIDGEGSSNDMVVVEYSYPYDFTDTIGKQFFFTVNNIEHKNIKGNYHIYYGRKIDLDGPMKNGNINGYKYFEQNTYAGVVRKNESNEIITDAGFFDNTKYDKPRFYLHQISLPFFLTKPKTEVRHIMLKQYLMLKKEHLLYVHQDSDKNNNNIKLPFPCYLLKPISYIQNNFHFYFEYEDKTLGSFADETVTLYLQLYIKNN